MKLCTSAGPTAWFSAYAVGTVPIRISMIRPMPFCPSFDPWKKLTPAHVSTISARIGHGGGALPFGACTERGILEQPLESRIKSAGQRESHQRRNQQGLEHLYHLLQSTPEAPRLHFISWLASPTPMIDPTMVCELDAGKPNHQVPRFHRIAAISSAKTIANPAP